MNKLAVNIERLIEKAGITATELARRTGVKQSMIYNIVKGNNTNPKLNTIKPLAEYFLVTISQLLGEEELPDQQNLDNNSRHEPIVRVPLFDIRHINNQENIITHILTDLPVSPESYAVILAGSTMEPRFSDGTILVADPSESPKNEDIVIVKFKDRAIPSVRQLFIDGDSLFTQSINEKFQDFTQLNIEAGDEILSVIMQAKMNTRTAIVST